MALGVSDHLLDLVAGLALPALAARVGLPHPRDPLEELVARCLELGHPGDPPAVVRALLGRGGRLQVARVGGELGLEAADLAAQLAPGAALVGVAGDVRERGGGDGVQGDRELTGLDALLARPLQRLADQLAQLAGDGRAVRDEGPGALPRGDQLLLLQPAVDRADGVDVDPAALRQVADAGQPLTGARLAGPDEGSELPQKLRPNRQLGGVVDREPLRDQERLPLRNRPVEAR